MAPLHHEQTADPVGFGGAEALRALSAAFASVHFAGYPLEQQLELATCGHGPPIPAATPSLPTPAAQASPFWRRITLRRGGIGLFPWCTAPLP